MITQDLPIRPLSAEAFAPFGAVLAATEDGTPLTAAEALLDLSCGTPRFYVMRLHAKNERTVRRITRHRRVTQVLAAVGGRPWLIAVAPPLDVDAAEARPRLEDIRAFRVPGDVALLLARGTWHAGPLFDEAEAAFFNLELADTNVTDHHSCHLVERYGTALRLID
ncbi:MAG: ureidoglycolate lyase [Xenophilus sp.]